MAFAIVERERRRARRDVRKRSWKAALAAGWCTSACVMLEYHALFLTVLLSLFALTVFWRPTRLLAFGLGGLVNVPLVMLFHWRAYGNPLTPGHQMLETQSFTAIHSTGLWGVVWPTWEHVQMLSIDPGFGFFGMSPFMAIGLVGVVVLDLFPFGSRGHRRDVRVAATCAALSGVLLVCLNAGIVNWRAGWTVGPRYLVAAGPFFAFLGGVTLDRLAGRSEMRRAVARGLGGGLALASILTIGTVGLVHDTLPESIRRPFLQFAVPMAWVGFVPHHVGEWFGWTSTTLWYVACGAMLLAAIVPGLFARIEERRLRVAVRVVAFAVALCGGMVPAFTEPEDNSRLWVVHQPAAFGPFWEPSGRDRISLLRIEAERHGTRGRGPCLWLKLAELEEIAGMGSQSMRSRAKAGSATRQQCGMRQIYPLPSR
jgi:hypothetical protein